jgi:hypothetical protein
LEENKAMVRRLVEGINAGDLNIVDELFSPRAARRTKRLFTEFHAAFPDWREEIVELVAEGDTVAGRFKCSDTHRGEFLGEAPTGRRMEVEEAFSGLRLMRSLGCSVPLVGQPLGVLPVQQTHQPAVRGGHHDGGRPALAHPPGHLLHRLVGAERRGAVPHDLLYGGLWL